MKLLCLDGWADENMVLDVEAPLGESVSSSTVSLKF